MWDLLKTTTRMMLCILGPLQHHFQETSKSRFPPEVVFRSFLGFSTISQGLCLRGGWTGGELCTENPPQWKAERLTASSYRYPAGKQVCSREMKYERSLIILVRFYHLAIIHSSLHFDCPSHTPEEEGGKAALSIPAHCWKGPCLQRCDTDREQGLGSAVTSCIKQQGNISGLCHKTTAITQG